MTWKSKGGCNRRHNDVQIKGQMDKGGYYDVEIKQWMQKRGNMMCKLKGQMDKGGHYDVQMKEWMQQGVL